jgi:predicted Rdx family selenoprotein
VTCCQCISALRAALLCLIAPFLSFFLYLFKKFAQVPTRAGRFRICVVCTHCVRDRIPTGTFSIVKSSIRTGDDIVWLVSRCR